MIPERLSAPPRLHPRVPSPPRCPCFACAQHFQGLSSPSSSSSCHQAIAYVVTPPLHSCHKQVQHQTRARIINRGVIIVAIKISGSLATQRESEEMSAKNMYSGFFWLLLPAWERTEELYEREKREGEKEGRPVPIAIATSFAPLLRCVRKIHPRTHSLLLLVTNCCQAHSRCQGACGGAQKFVTNVI